MEWRVNPVSEPDPFFCILCVEKDVTLRKAVRAGLENYGFEVVTAWPGVDAVMQYRARPEYFGTIILGHAPSPHGAEFARSVRETGYRGRIVVMADNLTVGELRAYEPHAISGFLASPLTCRSSPRCSCKLTDDLASTRVGKFSSSYSNFFEKQDGHPVLGQQ